MREINLDQGGILKIWFYFIGAKNMRTAASLTLTIDVNVRPER